MNIEGTRTLFKTVVEAASAHMNLVEMERAVAEGARKRPLRGPDPQKGDSQGASKNGGSQPQAPPANPNQGAPPAVLPVPPIPPPIPPITTSVPQGPALPEVAEPNPAATLGPPGVSELMPQTLPSVVMTQTPLMMPQVTPAPTPMKASSEQQNLLPPGTMPNVSSEVPLNILGNMVTVAPGVSRPEPVVTFVSGVVNTSEGLSTTISGPPLNTTTLHSQSVVTPIIIGQHLVGSPQQSGLKRPFPRGAQTPGGVPAKVRVLGSTVEGLTAPTVPSLPVTVNIARFLQTYPSQAPTPGVASYLDTGGSQSQMVFTHAPMGTPQLP